MTNSPVPNTTKPQLGVSSKEGGNKPVEIDVTQTVRYLTGAFSRATQGMERAARVKDKNTGKYVTNELYDLQVTFSYLIDDIMRGPKYFVQKLVSDCNQFINDISSKNTKPQ